MRKSLLTSFALLGISALVSNAQVEIAPPQDPSLNSRLPQAQIKTPDLAINQLPRDLTQDTNSQVKSDSLDANKEVIDYEDAIIDSLKFIETEIRYKNDTNLMISQLINKHHDNDQVYQYLSELSQLYPDITRLYHLNPDSVEGRKLWVLEISEEPGKHIPLKPEFRYIGNMHGNEVVGREVLLHLARLLVENYKAAELEPADDTRPTGPKFVRKLLKSTRLHLMPTMNPDGYVRSSEGCRFESPSRKGRLNANNIDLNRNFPDPINGNTVDANTQPEVRAIIDWSRSIPFVLSGNIHSGALLVNYPYDGAYNASQVPQYRASPDDDVFRHLAKIYSTSHPTMSDGKPCYDYCGTRVIDNFTDGITNGAKWYPLYGGIQDWIYEFTSEMDLTLELGCRQYPPASELYDYWSKNKRSLINFIRATHQGIKGIISDSLTGHTLPNVTIQVANRSHNVYSSEYGDYFRILLPGFYEIMYLKEGYYPEKIFASVDATMAQIINIKLRPLNADSNLPDGNIYLPSESKSDGTSGKTRSLVIANLVLTILVFIALIASVIGFVMFKTKFFRGRSMSMEMHSRARSGSGISRPMQQGGSINPHLAT